MHSELCCGEKLASETRRQKSVGQKAEEIALPTVRRVIPKNTPLVFAVEVCHAGCVSRPARDPKKLGQSLETQGGSCAGS